MKKPLLKNSLVVGVIFILILSSFVSSISGVFNDTRKADNDFKNSYESQEKIVVSCQTYGIPGKSLRQIEMSKTEAEKLLGKINDFARIIANDPLSKDNKQLQGEIILDAKEYNLLPKDITLQSLQPSFSPQFDMKNPKKVITPVIGNRGTASLCNFVTYGSGMQFPIIILPRLIPILLTPIPRLFLHWSANEGFTSCGSYLTGTGFMAEGMQRGTALGFWGIGFSVFIPPVMAYGFIGYALFATCTAEEIEPWPPNYAPEVSAISPANGAKNVAISISELSFQISDENGDKMDYTVTTDPDIGSGSESNKPGGTYSIPTSGLEGSEDYTWTVEVSDGQKTIEKSFIFTTEEVAPIVSDPNPSDGERYISIDLPQLSFKLKDPQGDLMDFTVETFPDIGSGSRSGVSDGTYSIDVSGLEYSREYKWFVNVTDGKNWKHKDFSFQAEHNMVFDPFDEGWQYRKKIIIDHMKVTGDLENFPVLISTTDNDLRDKAQDDGDDILFMDGNGDANRLYHEIEYFDSSFGEFISWVNITNLSSDQDTIFYMYYGNSNSDNQQAPEFVWDSNYQGVWHLSEDGTGLRHDSTNNYRHATAYDYDGDEGVNDGIINGADDFDGNNDHLRTGVSFDYEYRTVSFWFNTDRFPSSDINAILSQSADTLLYGSIGANVNTDSLVLSAGREQNPFTYPISTHTWYCVQMIRNGPDTEYYIDGDLVHTGISGTGGSSWGANKNLVIATDRTMIRRFFDGTVDEIRISNTARSATCFSTEFNNQNDPSSFMSFGPEETGP